MFRFGALICSLFFSISITQAQVITPQLLVPSPLGVALSVGKWIYDIVTKEQVYYIEVEGVGPSSAQARSNGFRLAVESALGSLISSETEVQNGRIKRDEIISYAAGFVDKFEIIQTQSVPEGYAVSMKVWVRRSALADRLLNRSEVAGQVDGPRASVQLQTINQERATGDALVTTVLNDFPRRAFDIELNQADIVRSNRNAQMEIPFTVAWNQDYLRSLWVALNATSQKTSNPMAVIRLNPGSWSMFKDYGGQAKFDDVYKYSLLVNRMVLSLPSVLVTIRGQNRTVLLSTCYRYQELDHSPDYVVTNDRFVELSPYQATAYVNGAYKMKSLIQIPISPSVLQQSSSIEMDIVLRGQCPGQ
jgi:hypothetical protein